jgi:hypothetical protein
MRCAKAKRLISDYIDKGLNDRQNVRLERHLQKCPECWKVLEDLQKIAASSRELEEVVPSQHAWLNLKARLIPEEQKILTFEPEKRARFRPIFFPPKLKYALSAALVLAVVAGAVMLGLKFKGGVDILGKKDPKSYTLAKLDEAERHYNKAIRALWEAVSAQKESMTLEIAEVFRENLKIIDASIIACRQIVLQEPDNIDARSFLLAAYREKVDFLQEMMEVGRPPSQKKEKRII